MQYFTFLPDTKPIVNAGEYYDVDANDWTESPFASQLNHSREQLIHILSSIIKTLGQVVINKPDLFWDPMDNQVVVTT